MPDPAWEIVYFDTPQLEDSPITNLAAWPPKVKAHMLAVLDDVAEAPPQQYSGGGYWEEMHGEMTGYDRVRELGTAFRSRFPRKIVR